MSVNRGGGQAKKKSVEKDDGKYDRDDVDTGPVRQKKRSKQNNYIINDEMLAEPSLHNLHEVDQ